MGKEKKKKKKEKRRGAQRSVEANLALITPHTPKSFITNAATSAVLQNRPAACKVLRVCCAALVLGGQKLLLMGGGGEQERKGKKKLISRYESSEREERGARKGGVLRSGINY